MHTVLIANRNPPYAEQLASDLRQAGFRVIDCGGPWPPRERCIRCDRGYCPLTEGADLMIYDASMTALDEDGTRYNLAVASAVAHPDVPLLLDWSPDGQSDPDVVREIKQRAPNVHAAVRDRHALVAEVRKLLAAKTTPTRSAGR
jgi:hypothetical protein